MQPRGGRNAFQESALRWRTVAYPGGEASVASQDVPVAAVISYGWPLPSCHVRPGDSGLSAQPICHPEAGNPEAEDSQDAQREGRREAAVEVGDLFARIGAQEHGIRH